MRVVTFGFQTWGFRTLQAVIELGHEVVLAVTHPVSDHSYKAIFSESVADLARDHDIPVHITNRAAAGTIDLEKPTEPDVIGVNSWYTWMPPELYELPPHGTLNLHDSLLPKFTGFSPVLWALISGESETGLTGHRMGRRPGCGEHRDTPPAPHGPRRYRHPAGHASHGLDSPSGAGCVERIGIWDRVVAAAEQGRTYVFSQTFRPRQSDRLD